MVVKRKPERKPVAYGYARVSTWKQVEKGLSLEAQEAAHKEFYAHRLKDKALWGGSFIDKETSKRKKGVSGKIRMRDRPAGGELCARLQPGDHVILVSLDRGFRRFRDAIDTVEGWVDQGIHVHLTREGISTDSEMGRMFMRLLAMFAEWERAMIAERTREALRQRRREGKTTGGVPKIGTRYEGIPGHRRVVQDEREQEVMRLIVRLHDTEGYTFDDVYLHFLKHNLRTRRNEAWSRPRIYRAYLSAKRSAGCGSTPKTGGSPDCSTGSPTTQPTSAGA